MPWGWCGGAVVRACVRCGRREGGTDWTGQEGRVPAGTVDKGAEWGRYKESFDATRELHAPIGCGEVLLAGGNWNWRWGLRSVFLRGCPRSGTRTRNHQAGVSGMRSGGSCRFGLAEGPFLRTPMYVIVSARRNSLPQDWAQDMRGSRGHWGTDARDCLCGGRQSVEHCVNTVCNITCL